MTARTLATSHDVPALVELLDSQCQLYEQLASLSGRQTDVIASGFAGDEAETDSSEQLLRLLAQRQQLIDRISAVHERLAPYRADWDALWGDLSAADRCRIGPLVSRVEQLLAGVIEQDSQDQRTLREAQTRTGGELRKTAVAGKAVNAYKPVTSPENVNRFTNQQG